MKKRAIKCIFLLFSIVILAGCKTSGSINSTDLDTNIPIPRPVFEVEKERSNPDRATRISLEQYRGPIIDAHVHLDPPSDGHINDAYLKEILEVVGETGVKTIIFMPTPNEGRRHNHEIGVKQKKKLFELDRQRIGLFCGSNYITYWLHKAFRNGYKKEELNVILKRLSKDLDSNEYMGVGEIGIYHFRKHGNQKVIQYPPNFEPFLRIMKLISEKQMWLDIHAEPVDPNGKSFEEQIFGGIELLYRLNPKLKLILSHTGMTNPLNARRILLKYPNLMMNIKIEKKHQRWRNLEPVVNPEGELYEDWAKLFNEMPERFMIGTDAKFGRKSFKMKKYNKLIKQMRRMLGTLNPNAAKLIAYENAKKRLVNVDF